MKRSFVLSFLCVAALVAAFGSGGPAFARRAAPTPSPTPPVADPAVTKIAWQQFVAWQAGFVKKELYTPDMQDEITDQEVSTSSQRLARAGTLESAVFLGVVKADGAPAGSTSYLYRMTCANGTVFMQFALMPDGKIGAMLFRPHAPGDDDGE